MPELPIDEMTGEQFEDYLQAGFEKLGYEVGTTPGYSDFGADLILVKDGVKTAVQAKRQARNVGVKAVQQAIAAMGHYKCDKSMVACNRPFTKQAIALAGNNDCILWNRAKMLKEFGEGEINRNDEEIAPSSQIHEQPSMEDALEGPVPLLPEEPDEEMQEALKLITQIKAHQDSNMLTENYWKTDTESPFGGGPYGWQEEYHAAGVTHKERCIIAGNRTGKTRSGAAETAMHLTGKYPPWWVGKRFGHAINAWIGSDTNETSREIVQAALLGDTNGTGWIPGGDIIDVTYRQAGIANVVDQVTVRHASGGVSRAVFKTYEQGRKKWQGTSVDWVWLDEEPPQDVFSEALTRTLDCGGLMNMTFTPLNGASEVVMHFLDGGTGIWYINATWDDALHLTEADKEQMMSSYAAFERETRTKGVPLAGTGVVYAVPDEMITVEPFEIPPHYRRLVGIDFGMDHPGGAVWIAHDTDLDIIYIYDCYKTQGQSAAYHGEAIRSRGDWIPVAWPHDGMQRDKGSGTALADSYRKHHVNMLPESACYKDDKQGAQPVEPVVQEIDDRMRTGRLKVFSTLESWFREKRMYHRDDGLIVKLHDDLMACTNYAVMMKRRARNQQRTYHPPQSASYDPFDVLSSR